MTEHIEETESHIPNVRRFAHRFIQFLQGLAGERHRQLSSLIGTRNRLREHAPLLFGSDLSETGLQCHQQLLYITEEILTSTGRLSSPRAVEIVRVAKHRWDDVHDELCTLHKADFLPPWLHRRLCFDAFFDCVLAGLTHQPKSLFHRATAIMYSLSDFRDQLQGSDRRYLLTERALEVIRAKSKDVFAKPPANAAFHYAILHDVQSHFPIDGYSALRLLSRTYSDCHRLVEKALSWERIAEHPLAEGPLATLVIAEFRDRVMTRIQDYLIAR